MAPHGVKTVSAPALPAPPGHPLERPPARRPGSVRRTSSLDMSWPGGQGTQMRILGRARDLRTAEDGSGTVLAHDSLAVGIGPDRTIEDIAAEPSRPGIAGLVGARGGGGLRSAIDAAVPDDRRDHTPLALILDDIAGASLVGGFAWSRHRPDWRGGAGPESPGDAAPRIQRRTMLGICAGFRPGSGALRPDGTPVGGGHNVAPVPPLTDPDDPDGWHPMEPLAPVGLRRARRMDVWREGGDFRIEAHFRDSCSDPDLVEVAVHEYLLDAAVDAATGTVTSLVARPMVLPYPECPAAAPNVDWLVGQPLVELRTKVLEVLRGPDCCTHLNDALRALADIDALLPSTA
ncbi:MAG: DUF2889 domain-containing protein [Acidimicrobiia bacterium]